MRNPIIYFFVITNIAIILGTPQTKAEENCKITYQKANSFGIFQQYACPVNGGPIISDKTPQFLSFNGEKLIKDFNIDCSSKKNDSIFICSVGIGRNSPLGGCDGTQYLIDTNGKKIVLFNFGIKNTCNQIQKISETQKKIKVALRRDTFFIYDIKSKTLSTPLNNETYTPIIDIESPAFDEYLKKSNSPGLIYEIAPPYSQKIK